MNSVQPSFTVHVDVTNPGQYFACCGLLELAHRRWPGAEGWFEDGGFHVEAAGIRPNGFIQVLSELQNTQVSPVETRGDPTTRPVFLAAFGIVLDCWLDEQGNERHPS